MIKRKMTQAFSKAAQTYDDAALVQEKSACELMNRLEMPRAAKALEIGCGTGFLTAKLLQQYRDIDWTITDVSKTMIQTCQAKMEFKATYKIMDGENPDQRDAYDLIVSNLAFQWFEDLAGSIARLNDLLSPEGCLFFSTLGPNSFWQWQKHLEHRQYPSGFHQYHTQEQLIKIGLNVEAIKLNVKFPNALSFLKSLKDIGAQTPKEGYQPLSTGALREVLKSWDDEGQEDITYEIFFCRLDKQ